MRRAWCRCEIKALLKCNKNRNKHQSQLIDGLTIILLERLLAICFCITVLGDSAVQPPWHSAVQSTTQCLEGLLPSAHGEASARLPLQVAELPGATDSRPWRQGRGGRAVLPSSISESMIEKASWVDQIFQPGGEPVPFGVEVDLRKGSSFNRRALRARPSPSTRCRLIQRAGWLVQDQTGWLGGHGLSTRRIQQGRVGFRGVRVLSTDSWSSRNRETVVETHQLGCTLNKEWWHSPVHLRFLVSEWWLFKLFQANRPYQETVSIESKTNHAILPKSCSILNGHLLPSASCLGVLSGDHPKQLPGLSSQATRTEAPGTYRSLLGVAQGQITIPQKGCRPLRQ